MKTLFSFLGRAMGDGENPSASRVMAVATVFFCVVLPMVIWAALSIAKRQLLEIPGSLIGFMSSASTLVLGLFHLNKREETKLPASSPAPATGGAS